MKIIVLANEALRNGDEHRESPLGPLDALPVEAEVVSVGADYAELIRRSNADISDAEVLFVASGTGKILAEVMAACPKLVWIQGLFAGLDHIKCSELVEAENSGRIVLTNAKGIFSSSLAEYVMLVCSHFQKNVPRWQANKASKKWETFTVGELRGSTMGIVGYGSIGEATAKLAKAYGMKVVACRRRPEISKDDPNIDSIRGMDALNDIMAESDYLVLCAALTPSTEKMISQGTLQAAKAGQVFINIGRGKLVDEDALFTALKEGTLRAAGLDVFATEPLPEASPLWDLPNVLISSHNADMTPSFRHDSVACFVENCRNFLKGGRDSLVNIVSAKEGY